MQAHVLVSFDGEEDRFLPEGPREVTFLNRRALIWVNIQLGVDSPRGSLLLRFWDTGERRRFLLPARPGFVFPSDIPNTVLVGIEKAVGMFNLATGLWTPLAKIPDANPRTIINDGEIVPGGDFILFGTKDTRFENPIAELYLMSLRNQQVHPLRPGQTCSNGKIIHTTDNGWIVYDIDTPTKLVTKSQLDRKTLQLSDPETVLDLRSEPAFPDGMVDCGDGTVIIAFYNPHRGGDGVARRYSFASGAAVEEWQIPGSPRVTCPLLLQREGRVQMVLTTATEGMPAEMRKESPNAGNLFIAETTLKTLPETEMVRL